MSECATFNCDREAAWLSLSEGDRRVRRCKQCCDAVADVLATLAERQQPPHVNASYWGAVDA